MSRSQLATRERNRRGGGLIAPLLVLCSFAASTMLSAAAPSQAQSADPEPVAAAFDPKRPPARELETSIADGFRLVAIGDIILTRSLVSVRQRIPGFEQLSALIARADAAYGNMETEIIDRRNYSGSPRHWREDVHIGAPPAVAKDLADAGIDIVSRANNHAGDWGVEGMRETSRQLNAAGIAHAGYGENLGLARMPAFTETPKGRVGLVSMASTYLTGADALTGDNGAAVRPGINPLAVTSRMLLPPDTYGRLEALSRDLWPDQPAGEASSLSIFGRTFGQGALGFDYEIDRDDRAANLRAIRWGKQNADFLIAAIHSHEPANAVGPAPMTDAADRPAGFLQPLARAAIDAGADTFITTGIHHLDGIEIYRGKPIFYGLGNMFWSSTLETEQPSDSTRTFSPTLKKAFRYPERATPTDLMMAGDATFFSNQETFESVLAECRFESGRLAELRLYPVALGYGEKGSLMGIPRPAPGRANAILDRIAERSAAFGTRIEFEADRLFGQVGVIRGAPK